MLREVTETTELCPVFEDGFAAVEAEYVFRLGHDAPSVQDEWTPTQAATLVAAMHVGVEIASSPLATINELGPTVIASDFGNNFGLLIGPEITQWQSRDLQTLRCEVVIEGKSAGHGSAASIPGGPLAALAFALALCGRRGYPLRAGQYVCTGATTGVHDIRVGETAMLAFEGIGTLSCQAIAAQTYAVRAAP
jgi:2-keto-4-pentenoate hydratase